MQQQQQQQMANEDPTHEASGAVGHRKYLPESTIMGLEEQHRTDSDMEWDCKFIDFIVVQAENCFVADSHVKGS